MFVQVIDGRVRDRDGLAAQMDCWVEQLAPGATGWLGDTSGVTADGTFVAIARFDSEEAARANSTRPEQGAWWERTQACFDGDVTFLDCPTVDLMGRPATEAGFVQVIQGTADRDQLLAAMTDVEEFFARVRPDILGALMAWPGDGTFTQVVYFTSEADARKGEAAELAPDDAARFGALLTLIVPTRFLDLVDPRHDEA